MVNSLHASGSWCEDESLRMLEGVREANALQWLALAPKKEQPPTRSFFKQRLPGIEVEERYVVWHADRISESEEI